MGAVGRSKSKLVGAGWVPGGCQDVSATKYITRVQWACPTPPSTLPPTHSAPAPTFSLTKIFLLWRSLWGVRGVATSRYVSCTAVLNGAMRKTTTTLRPPQCRFCTHTHTLCIASPYRRGSAESVCKIDTMGDIKLVAKPLMRARFRRQPP